MPRIVKENGEKRTFFQLINFLVPYVYAIGIIVILLWMAVSSLIIGIQNIKVNPGALILQPIKSEVNPTKTVDKNPGISQNQKQETWLDLLVKPIVESNFNKIIFRGLFLLVIWMLLFLIIPVAFKNLKRFKFFNMEFEVDHVEKAAIETVEISGPKCN